MSPRCSQNLTIVWLVMAVSCMANFATSIMILAEIMVKTSSIVVFGECVGVVWGSYFQLRSTYVLDFFFLMVDHKGISTIIFFSTRRDLILLKGIKFWSRFTSPGSTNHGTSNPLVSLFNSSIIEYWWSIQSIHLFSCSGWCIPSWMIRNKVVERRFHFFEFYPLFDPFFN